MSYFPEDVVSVSGSSWICISPSLDDAPEDSPGHWEVLAHRGRGAEVVEDLLNVDASERGPGTFLGWNHARQCWEARSLTSTTGDPTDGSVLRYDPERGRLLIAYDGTWVDASPPVRGIQGKTGPVYRSLTIEHPNDQEHIPLMVTAHELSLSRVVASITGAGSVTFSLWQGDSPDLGTAILSDRTVSIDGPLWISISPPEVIPANRFFWLTTSETTAGVDQMFFDFNFEVDH